MTRMLIARDRSALDDVGRRLIDEGSRALPDPYGDGTEELLPQKRQRGRCRICGERAQLTSEHIPPGAALNLGRDDRRVPASAFAAANQGWGMGAHLDITTNIRGTGKRNARFTLQHAAMLTPRQPEGCVPVVVSRCARSRVCRRNSLRSSGRKIIR